jgi:hypothetical protein
MFGKHMSILDQLKALKKKPDTTDYVAQKAALDVINRSTFSPLLGGSRRMAQIAASTGSPTKIEISSDTDWDFYATYHWDLHKYLSDNGFHETDFSSKMVETGYALDDEAHCILERDKVQIVLRKSAGFYLNVFENIPVQFYHDYLWKSSPAKPDRSQIQPIFNALFAVAHGMEGK